MSLWVDTGGQVLKSHGDMLGGMDIFRTTRDGAPRRRGPARPDPDLDHQGPPQDRHPRGHAQHHLPRRPEDEPPADVVPADRRQSLAAGTTKNSAVLVVKTAGPHSGNPGEEKVDAKYPPAQRLHHERRPDRQAPRGIKAVASAVDGWRRRPGSPSGSRRT